MPCVGRSAAGRQAAAQSAQVTRCLVLVQREGRWPRHAVTPRHGQGLGEVAGRDRAGDPALLRRLPAEGIADKELSALLARDLLVPIVHDTTYEALRGLVDGRVQYWPN
jgi:hypothetical protein